MKKLLPLLLLLLSACSGTESEFSRRPCNLIIENNLHNDATLASAMQPQSGIFVRVTVTGASPSYFAFASNQGQTSRTIFNAKDDQRTLILGMNGGLIVGQSFYGTLYAYDLQCPNCFDPDALPVRSHPLSFTTDGNAQCAACHRAYDLNNGGIVAKGDGGKKLTRYYAATTGPYGVLSVN